MEEYDEQQHQVEHSVLVLPLDAEDPRRPERRVQLLHLVPREEVKLEHVLDDDDRLKQEKRRGRGRVVGGQ